MCPRLDPSTVEFPLEQQFLLLAAGPAHNISPLLDIPTKYQHLLRPREEHSEIWEKAVSIQHELSCGMGNPKVCPCPKLGCPRAGSQVWTHVP